MPLELITDKDRIGRDLPSFVLYRALNAKPFTLPMHHLNSIRRSLMRIKTHKEYAQWQLE